MKPSSPPALALGLLLTFAGGTDAAPNGDPAALRRAVVAAKDGVEKAAAYRAYFGRVGRAGRAGLTRDEDPGIALRAAWEMHTKAVERPARSHRADDIYDPAELGQFVAFLKAGAEAPVPGWWEKCVTDVDLFPGRHHAVIGAAERPGDGPKEREAATGATVPAGAELEKKGDRLVSSAGGRAVEFPADTFDGLAESYYGVIGEKRSAVAGYSVLSGSRSALVGFEGRGGKPARTADVWGPAGPGGAGFHWVEVLERDGAVYVFGAESRGMYLEAFDPATGTCRYWFCTCYRFHNSEAWGL